LESQDPQIKKAKLEVVVVVVVVVVVLLAVVVAVVVLVIVVVVLGKVGTRGKGGGTGRVVGWKGWGNVIPVRRKQ
jgi:cobalamin synthase